LNGDTIHVDGAIGAKNLAGLGYLTDGFGTILLGSYGAYADIATMAVAIPSLVGEGALMVWLIVRGIDSARFPSST
jgi:hypothetical protein